jgi:hypothetical protein
MNQTFRGLGNIWTGFHNRKYADVKREASYMIRFHNLYGFSEPIYFSIGRANTDSWGGKLWGTALPLYQNKANCPTDLTVTVTAIDTIVLNWTPSVNTNTQKVQVTIWDNNYNSWSTYVLASGLSSSTSTYTWTGGTPNAIYDFQIVSDNDSKAESNFAFCITPSISATITRPAPSNIVGQPSSTTSIVWNWVRNATDNTDVEYALDGGSWTSLGSATVTTLTSSGLGAGTAHSIKLRNKWAGPLYSSEAESPVVLTPSSPVASTDPTNLSLSTPSNNMIRANWVNNGSVAQTLDYKRSIDASWTNVALTGTPNTKDITGLAPGTHYDVRVKATSGTNYITGSISTLAPPDIDPWCVLLDSEITMEDWSVLQARYVINTHAIRTGKSNRANVKESIMATTSGFFVVTNEQGDSLGCSPSHVFITSLDETSTLNAKSISNLIGQNKEVYVKMNDRGIEYLSKVFSVEYIETEMGVWTPGLTHIDHTYIANKFVCHNVKPRLT